MESSDMQHQKSNCSNGATSMTPGKKLVLNFVPVLYCNLDANNSVNHVILAVFSILCLFYSVPYSVLIMHTFTNTVVGQIYSELFKKMFS